MDIKWLRGTEDLNEACRIRQRVFVIEQNVPEEEEWDKYDESAHHIVIFKESKAVGTGRLANIDGQFILGRIAVLKEYRGSDIGRIIVENLLKKAKENGAQEVYIHAQIQVVGFYEKLGFKSFGDTFLEAGIKHIGMMAKLDNLDRANN